MHPCGAFFVRLLNWDLTVFIKIDIMPSILVMIRRNAMTADEYKREAKERLEKIINKSSKQTDVSFMDDDKQTYVVATAHHTIYDFNENPVDATDILCIPIKANKLDDDDGLRIRALSREEHVASGGYYNAFTDRYSGGRSSCKASMLFRVYKEKSKNPLIEIESAEYVDVHELNNIFSYVKKHKRDKGGKEAFNICNRLISPTALERRRQSIVTSEEQNNHQGKYRKLRRIVEACHAVGRCAGKLHRSAARKKKEEKNLKIAEELKKIKLARNM